MQNCWFVTKISSGCRVDLPRQPTCGHSQSAAEADVRHIREDEMLRSPLRRLAGPMALAAGVLPIVALRVMLPFDPNDHVATLHEGVPPCDA